MHLSKYTQINFNRAHHTLTKCHYIYIIQPFEYEITKKKSNQNQS